MQRYRSDADWLRKALAIATEPTHDIPRKGRGESGKLIVLALLSVRHTAFILVGFLSLVLRFFAIRFGSEEVSYDNCSPGNGKDETVLEFKPLRRACGV